MTGLSPLSALEAEFLCYESRLNAYWTHRPLLWAALMHTATCGAQDELPVVVELGMGYGSTPLLHRAGDLMGFAVWSYEENPEFFAPFQLLHDGRNHRLELVKRTLDREGSGYDEAPLVCPEGKGPCIEVLFIDHAPVSRRIVDIERGAFVARVVVVHDTFCEVYPGYERLPEMFRYSLHDQRVWPNTSVFSNYVDVSGWKLP